GLALGGDVRRQFLEVVLGGLQHLSRLSLAKAREVLRADDRDPALDDLEQLGLDRVAGLHRLGKGRFLRLQRGDARGGVRCRRRRGDGRTGDRGQSDDGGDEKRARHDEDQEQLQVNGSASPAVDRSRCRDRRTSIVREDRGSTCDEVQSPLQWWDVRAYFTLSCATSITSRVAR